MKTKIIYQHPLKDEIYRQGYTLTSFAEKIYISRWTLNNIFKQRFKKNHKEIVRLIAEGLNLSIEQTEKLIRSEQ